VLDVAVVQHLRCNVDRPTRLWCPSAAAGVLTHSASTNGRDSDPVPVCGMRKSLYDRYHNADELAIRTWWRRP